MELNVTGRTSAIVRHVETGESGGAVESTALSFAVPQNTAVLVECYVEAREASGSRGWCTYHLGVMYRDAGDAVDPLVGFGIDAGARPIGSGIVTDFPALRVGNDGTGELNECRVRVLTPPDVEWDYTIRIEVIATTEL